VAQESCVRCGSALTDGSLSCAACGAQRPVASPWGALDREQGVPPRRRIAPPSARDSTALTAFDGPLDDPLSRPHEPPAGAAPGRAVPRPRAPSAPLLDDRAAPAESDPDAAPAARLLTSPIAARPGPLVPVGAPTPLDLPSAGVPRSNARRSPITGPLQVPTDRQLSGPLRDRQLSSPLAASGASSRAAQTSRAVGRAPSAPLSGMRTGPTAARGSEPQHPALRGNPGQNTPSRAISAVEPAHEVSAQVAAQSEVGMIGFGDAFSDPGAVDLVAALELVTQPPPPAREVLAPLKQQPLKQEPQAQLRQPPVDVQARQLAAFAGYGERPRTLLQTLPYFFRVSARKRVLGTDLDACTQRRQHLERDRDDALCALGEGLYARRSEPALAPITAQLRAVSAAREQVGAKVAAGKRVAATRRQERDVLLQSAEQHRQQAVPLAARSEELGEQLADRRAEMQRCEQRAQALEAEQKALKSSGDPSVREALKAERQTALARVQQLKQELLPLAAAHAEVERAIASHSQAVAQIEAQQARLSDVGDRNDDRQLMAADGAVSAYREALKSLAQAAQRERIADPAGSIVQAPIAQAREQEQRLRQAIVSYDASAYKRGMQLAAGSVTLLLALFAALIAL
jgi:hypothetical protein